MIVVLELPEPPSRRAEDKLHWRPRARLVFETKRDIWRAAIGQHEPLAEPPRRVRVSAHFRLWQLDDSIDNLRARLKRVLDALKQNHVAHDSLRWRLAPDMPASWLRRGFFWDDAGEFCESGEITQEINRRARGLTLTITPIGEAS